MRSFGHGLRAGVERLSEGRRSERRKCDLVCRISTRFGDINCVVTDVSSGGVGAKVDRLVRLHVGDRIDILDGPLLGVSGIVRWAMLPNYGVEFEQSERVRRIAIRFYNSLA